MLRSSSRPTLLVALLLSGCRSTGPGAAEPAVAVDPEDVRARDGEEELAALAIGRVEEGEYEAARLVLDDLLFEEALARARGCLAAGSPEDALLAVDKALELLPGDEETRLLKADASLRLAEDKIRAGGGAGGLIEGVLRDALGYYRGVGESPHSLFGASRAAWLLGEREQALDLARRGRAQLGESDAGLSALGLCPERILAEQVFAASADAHRSGATETAALFRECEEALASLLGRESDDPWVWSRLSDLYEWQGLLSQARSALERGLLRTPEDAGLLERLPRVTRALAGSAQAVAALERYTAAHPRVPAGRWQLALARFQGALEAYQGTPRILEPDGFTRAEEEFTRARELAPELTRDALGYEVVCRLARGWCAFHAGDLDAAQAEFLAMDALFERGIEWSLPGELESGIQGLFLVADAHRSRRDNRRAGEVFEQLRALQPEQVSWANNAGFFLREAGVDLELEGRRLCRAARGGTVDPTALEKLRALPGVSTSAPGTAQERADLARAADERFARARGLMERSWNAYESAAALAPDDVRVVNDAALLLVHYLHRDLERAEGMLRHCIVLGAEQVREQEAALAAAPAEEQGALESQLFDLKSAWGDAHENLGALAWVHRKDAAAARPLLEKAVAIGPDRPSVVNELLPQVRGEHAPEAEDRWNLLAWARPCEVR